jgi:hypothetical protein
LPACSAIEAKAVDEVMTFATKRSPCGFMCGRRRIGVEADAFEIRLRAEKRVGEMMAAQNLPPLRLKLADTHQEMCNLTVIAMRPDLKPATKDLILKLLESCRAEVKLRVKALRYAEGLREAPPSATASPKSGDSLKETILLGWRMAIAEAQFMLVQKAKQALRR